MRAEIASLIESDLVAHGFVDGQFKSAVIDAFEEDLKPALPRRIGPYSLIRELGRGGMGTVYLGRRDDEQYNMEVAIKVVSPGMDTAFVLRRFRRERQTLANLHHPHIARLLDGGTTNDGLPYIVMEFVDGSWITEYCRSHELSVEERLRLFLKVCSAAEHAHRHFVVHRDIKPGNILVDKDGEPKLLDFGICKLLYADPLNPDETMASESRMLTPDYASPEQIRGDLVTIASDVYSLGAVLYELLAGVKPHRFSGFSLAEIERAICSVEPQRPSLATKDKATGKRLAGDLDTILLRALEKDPNRRYPTVGMLSADLERHLSHQPVLARPDTTVYRMRKFIRRHSGFVAASVAVAATLVGGTAVSMYQARLANERLQLVRRLANIFVFDVHDAVRYLPGSIKARKLIVETGKQYLDAVAATSNQDASLAAELAAAYVRIGKVEGDALNANLGNEPAAVASFEKARSLLVSAARKEPGNRAVIYERTVVEHKLGGMYYSQGSHTQAMLRYEEALASGTSFLASHPADQSLRIELSQIEQGIALIARDRGNYQESIDHSRKALNLLLGDPKKEPDRDMQFLVAGAYSTIATAESQIKQIPQAREHFDGSIKVLKRLVAEAPTAVNFRHQLMLSLAHKADMLGDEDNVGQVDSADAISTYQEVVQLAKLSYEDDPEDERAVSDYGIALSRLSAMMPASDHQRRLPLLNASIRLLQDASRRNPKSNLNRRFLAHANTQLGDSLAAKKRPAEAIAAWQKSYEITKLLASSGTSAAVVTFMRDCRKLALAEAERGHRLEALQHAEEARGKSEKL